MSNQTRSKSHERAVILGSQISYLGVNPSGQIGILSGGKKFLVTGSLYERSSYQGADDVCKWSRKLVATTPGYEPSASLEQSAVAHCQKSGKSYRIVGQFKLALSGNQSEPKKLTASPANVPKHKATTEKISLPQKGEGATKCDQPGLSEYKRVLDKVAAQRCAGFDPQVRMAFVTSYVGESKASLYRKMGSTFPSPVKRGRSSFWLLSAIDAYMTGGSHE